MGTTTNRETLELLSNAKERGLNNYELKDKAASFLENLKEIKTQ